MSRFKRQVGEDLRRADGMASKRTAADKSVRYELVGRRAAILAFLSVALAAVAYSDALHAALLDLLAVSDDLIAQHPVLGPSVFVAFAAVSAMFAFVSVAIVVPVAVSAWGEPASMLLLWLGWILGGVATYCAGRFLGRPAVRWLTAGTGLRRFESRVRANAPFSLVLLFQLALPSEIPGYVLGLARYHFATYLLALAIAELPYTVATVYLGASFVEGRGTVILAVGIGLVLLGLLAFHVLRRRLSRRANEPATGDMDTRDAVLTRRG